MMMYRVIRYFTDLQDNDYAYNVGDVYPRQGIVVSSERITELASAENLQRVPLIEEVKAKSEPVADVTDEETADDEPLEDETPDIERKPKRKKRGE
jgi:hypothetical protein